MNPTSPLVRAVEEEEKNLGIPGGARANTVQGQTRLRVLIACEFSGVVRDAFTTEGHHAESVDLLPTEKPGPHFQGHVNERLQDFWDWDLMIAFPPCTYLAVSGARWWKDAGRMVKQNDAILFVAMLYNSNIKRVAIENPIGVLSTQFRKPDQIIQPWQFGHGETKATCLWLKNLPKLIPTDIVSGRVARVHRASPRPDRWKERSRTLPGIAKAMAQQWGSICAFPEAKTTGVQHDR